MEDVPVLVCTSGKLVGRRFRVSEGGIGIGRASENAVVIQDDGVSRYHARLLLDNGSLWLQDAGSRNGVFVNGSRLTGHRALKVGDAITIAQHTFELHWEADAPESAEAERDTSSSSDPKGEETDPVDGSNRAKRPWYWPF